MCMFASCDAVRHPLVILSVVSWGTHGLVDVDVAVDVDVDVDMSVGVIGYDSVSSPHSNVNLWSVVV